MKEIIEPYGFIYITTNMLNGKRYIGQKRFKYDWKQYLGSGKLIKQSYKKYGKENFVRDIVQIAYSEEELNRLEQEWIRNYNAVNNDDFYNIAEGGYGNPRKGMSKKDLESWSEKQREVRLGEKSFWFGRKHSEEELLKMSKARQGIKYSEESKRKISEALSGKNHPNYGKHLKSDTKEKIGLKQKGGNNHMAKKIICLTTNETFEYILEGENKYNIASGGISKCCKGKVKTCGKHPITNKRLRWMYYDEYIKLQN